MNLEAISPKPFQSITQKPRLAYFSPLPPAQTGVADYSWELLPHLSQHCDLTLFVPDPTSVTAEVHQRFDVRASGDFPSARLHFDLPLYQMGNSIHHDFVLGMALRYPGIVVLHDYYIHHLVAEVTGGVERYDSYVRELAYAEGLAGVEAAWQIRYGQRPHPLFSMPLNDRLADRSLAFIVHSQTAADLLLREERQFSVAVVPQLMTHKPEGDMREYLPESLNITPDSLFFASVGQVTFNRRLDLVLKAFARLYTEHPNCRFLIIGKVDAQLELAALIDSLGIRHVVHHTGYVPNKDVFAKWIATADVVINIRQPTLGETSASVLRAMAAGRPVIVYAHGWYSELPDDTCLKISSGDDTALLEAMTLLATDGSLRRQIGHNARATILQGHDPASCARQYSAFIRNFLDLTNRKYL